MIHSDDWVGGGAAHARTYTHTWTSVEFGSSNKSNNLGVSSSDFFGLISFESPPGCAAQTSRKGPNWPSVAAGTVAICVVK